MRAKEKEARYKQPNKTKSNDKNPCNFKQLAKFNKVRYK